MNATRRKGQFAKKRQKSINNGDRPQITRECLGRVCKRQPSERLLQCPLFNFRNSTVVKDAMNKYRAAKSSNSCNYNGSCVQSATHTFQTKTNTYSINAQNMNWRAGPGTTHASSRVFRKEEHLNVLDVVNTEVEEDAMSLEAPSINTGYRRSGIKPCKQDNMEIDIADNFVTSQSCSRANLVGYETKTEDKTASTIYTTNHNFCASSGNSSNIRSDYQTQRQDSDDQHRHLSSDNLETDIFYLQSLEQEHLRHAPAGDATDFSKNVTKSPERSRSGLPVWLTRQRRPSQSDELYVSHPLSTDSNLGDFFGAKCETYKDKQYDYHRHVFKDVRAGRPADQMNLRDKDEIVLINNNFAPNLDHSEVLNLFHHLKVDGKTRITLVIRRKEAGSKGWQWYESSAILVPDTRYLPRGHQLIPEVSKPVFTLLPNKEKDWVEMKHYRIQYTENYLDLKATGVTVSPLHNNDSDKTKTITKKSHVSQDSDGRYTYWCCLCGHGNIYLAVNEHTDQVYIQEQEPKPFKYCKMGSYIFFQYNDKFLSCDGKNMSVSNSEYKFEELPPGAGLDYCDMADIHSDNCDMSSSISSRESFDSWYGASGRESLDGSLNQKRVSRRLSLKRGESVGLSGPINGLNIGKK